MLLNFNINWFYKLDYITDLEALGQILYTHYVFQFLNIKMIPLIAIVGYIKLQLRYKLIENLLDQTEKDEQQLVVALQEKNAEILNLKSQGLDLKTEILDIKSQIAYNAGSTDLLLLVEHNQFMLQFFGIAFLGFGLILIVVLIFYIISSQNYINKRKGD